MEKQYYVYIMASISKTIYVGMTNDLVRRVAEHKEGKPGSFTQKYSARKLVYFEETQDVMSAIEREKTIKKWRREKKIELIESMNPDWRDLYDAL